MKFTIKKSLLVERKIIQIILLLGFNYYGHGVSNAQIKIVIYLGFFFEDKEFSQQSHFFIWQLL